MTAYLVEMAIEATAEDKAPAAQIALDIAELYGKQFDGDVMYTVSGSNITLAITTVSPDQIENVPPLVVGRVRALLHEHGYPTPGWPEPVDIGDVHVFEMSDDIAEVAN